LYEKYHYYNVGADSVSMANMVLGWWLGGLLKYYVSKTDRRLLWQRLFINETFNVFELIVSMTLALINLIRLQPFNHEIN